MRVYMSVDMEGIAGVVVSADQCSPTGHDYTRFRRLMTLEANAAIEGALEAGATEVWVNDVHGPMTNLLIEELHPQAELISGINKPLLQVQGIETGFDALFCVGYHLREGGGDGVLNHTLLGRAVYEVRINGEPVDEAGLNARVAGAYNCPIALITGDSILCAEAIQRFPGIAVAAVKEAYDRYSARCLTPERARKLIREQAVTAMHDVRHGRVKALTVSTPVTIEADFKNTGSAHMTAEWIPGVERRGPRTIAVTGDEYVRTFKTFMGCLFLGLHLSEGRL